MTELTPAINEKTQEFLVKRALVKELCLRSPYYLGREVLGYDRFGATQIAWDRWVEQNINLAGQRPGKYLILQPRETYKTTFFTITLSICFLLNNPELSIMIANERFDNAMDFLKEIIRHFESNEKLRYLFGDLVPRSANWGTGAFRLRNKTRNHKEPSLWVAGIGAAITSKHPDIIICDDIAGKKDKESEAGRAQTMSFFQDSWDLLSKDHGIYIIEGTRKHVSDIYAHIINTLNPQLELEGLEPFKILCTPAHAADGSLNFPDLLPEEKLRELRIVKEGRDGVDYATYMAEYELNPLLPDEQVFKTIIFEDVKRLKFTRFVLWTDPALSEKKSACYSAIVVLAEVKDECYWFVLYASIQRRSPSEIRRDHNRIFRMVRDMYKIDGEAYMEDNGFQALLASEAVAESADERDPIPTVGRTSSENKVARIRCLEPFISQGFIRFREDWRTAPEGYALLIEQLRSFPQGLVDAVDALHGAHQQTRNTVSFRRL